MSDAALRVPVFTKGFAWLTAAAAAALCILIALGSWQVKRLYWKEALIARVEAQIAAPPVALESILPEALGARGPPEDPEYRPVTVKGVFDSGKEFFYYATLEGKSGFHIYTPFILDGPSGAIVFVNRGFVPADRKAPQTRPGSRSEGRVAVTGLLRWPDTEKPNRFIPDNDAGANIFFWRDLALMRELAGLGKEKVLPFFIYEERKKEEGEPSLPVGGVAIVDFPNNHLSYAVTWYGLALTLVGVYGALLLGRARAPAGVAP